jgi:hypothetical protein
MLCMLCRGVVAFKSCAKRVVGLRVSVVCRGPLPSCRGLLSSVEVFFLSAEVFFLSAEVFFLSAEVFPLVCRGLPLVCQGLLVVCWGDNWVLIQGTKQIGTRSKTMMRGTAPYMSTMYNRLSHPRPFCIRTGKRQ